MDAQISKQLGNRNVISLNIACCFRKFSVPKR